MAIELIIDDRVDVSHLIRTKSSRRTNKVLFHLLKRPFEDSDGYLVEWERRAGYDRRMISKN